MENFIRSRNYDDIADSTSAFTLQQTNPFWTLCDATHVCSHISLESSPECDDYLLCTEPCCWLEAFGGLILLLGWTISIFWPFSSGLGLGAWDSVWLCDLSCVTAGFCLFRIPSLPARISFSPTVSIRARPAAVTVPGHSFLGEGSLDPTPAVGGRASLEALDILQVSGSVTHLSLSQPVRLQLCPVGKPRLLSSQWMWLASSSVLWLVQVDW